MSALKVSAAFPVVIPVGLTQNFGLIGLGSLRRSPTFHGFSMLASHVGGLSTPASHVFGLANLGLLLLVLVVRPQ